MTVRFTTQIEALTLRDAWLQLVAYCEDIADEKVQPNEHFQMSRTRDIKEVRKKAVEESKKARRSYQEAIRNRHYDEAEYCRGRILGIEKVLLIIDEPYDGVGKG